MVAELNVEGMSCEMCVGHVTKALKAVHGVETAKVDLAGKCAVVEYDADKATLLQLIDAIIEEGYEASPKNA